MFIAFFASSHVKACMFYQNVHTLVFRFFAAAVTWLVTRRISLRSCTGEVLCDRDTTARIVPTIITQHKRQI